MADRALINAVAAAPTVTVTGTFYRHSSPKFRELVGSAAGGRWGPEGTYPVLYLGRPVDSVVVEAYRHLVDPFPGMRPEFVQPRQLTTCEVAASNVLDLRDPAAQQSLALDPIDFTSDVGDYERCVKIGQAAHQLELHGLIAPSASGLGETLALFERHLPMTEHPDPVARERWDRLPDDPRIKQRNA